MGDALCCILSWSTWNITISQEITIAAIVYDWNKPLLHHPSCGSTWVCWGTTFFNEDWWLLCVVNFSLVFHCCFHFQISIKILTWKLGLCGSILWRFLDHNCKWVVDCRMTFVLWLYELCAYGCVGAVWVMCLWLCWVSLLAIVVWTTSANRFHF